MEYPAYFRKNGRCVKVTSPTQAQVIILPPDSTIPERFTSTFPTPERLLERIKGMNQVDAAKWGEFQFTFYQQVDGERQTILKNKIS